MPKNIFEIRLGYFYTLSGTVPRREVPAGVMTRGIRDLQIENRNPRICDLRQTIQIEKNIGLYGTTKALTEIRLEG